MRGDGRGADARCDRCDRRRETDRGRGDRDWMDADGWWNDDGVRFDGGRERERESGVGAWVTDGGSGLDRAQRESGRGREGASRDDDEAGEGVARGSRARRTG